MRVLVAEDDPGLRSVLGRGLREGGYIVDEVADGEEALNYLRAYEYEVVVLDWRMPRLSGLEVVRLMRQGGSLVPVLMLTARDEPADRVAGLDSGADDYLVKPFDFDELLARLRALQRRAPTQQATILEVGNLVVDPSTRQVTVDGEPVVLTNTEFSILELLARRSPAVVERRSIAVQVWDNEADAVGSNTIDVHMARLRSKLAGATANLETVRGVGYRIA